MTGTAAAIQAIAALIQCWLIYQQRVLMKRQADIAAQQTRIQQAQSAALLRPRVIVRFTEFHTRQQPGEPWKAVIRYRLTNIGGSDATLTKIGFQGRPIFPAAIPTSAEDEIKPCKPRILRAGESLDGVSEAQITKDEFNRTVTGTANLQDGGRTILKTLVFYGGLAYTDQTGLQRQTCVWRVMDPKTWRFTPVDADGYDYAD